jgi:hypothetical protein
MSKIKVTTISDPDNDNTAITVGSTGDVSFSGDISVTGTIPASQLTGALPALDGSALTGVGGSAEIFEITMSAAQSVSFNTTNQIHLDTLVYGESSALDATNYRYTPTTAGYYFVHGFVYGGAVGLTAAYLKKNGNYFGQGTYNRNLDNYAYDSTITAIVHCNGTSDYLELVGHSYTTSYGASCTLKGFLIKAD